MSRTGEKSVCMYCWMWWFIGEAGEAREKKGNEKRAQGFKGGKKLGSIFCLILKTEKNFFWRSKGKGKDCREDKCRLDRKGR